jgi:hypothetical protein
MILLLKDINFVKRMKKPLFLAALGAVVGISMGFISVTEWIKLEALPNTVVAQVNHMNILRVEYEKALTLLASEKRDPLTDNDRALVLERLIEEELLVQHGLSVGLMRSDRMLRVAMIESLIEGVTVEYQAIQGTEFSAGNKVDGVSQGTILRDYVEQLRNTANISWVK